MTDTGKWSDPWFMDMPQDFKLVYLYVLDNCDAAGVWKVNRRMVEFCIDSKIDWDMFISYMGDRLHQISEEKWWLTKFCDFQYGHIPENTTSRPLIAVLSLLDSHGLSKGYTKGIDTLKDKDKDKNQDQDKDKDKSKDRRFRPPTIHEVSQYCIERQNGIDAEQFVDHYIAREWKFKTGQPMKDWRAAVRTWEKNDFSRSKQKQYGKQEVTVESRMAQKARILNALRQT